MVVSISVLLYNWSIEQAQKVSDQLERTTDPLVCAELGISIDGACQTHTLVNINITNTNKFEIKGLVIRMIGLYPDDPDYLDEVDYLTAIPTGDTELISVLKKSTLTQVKIVPYTERKKKNIFCEDKAIIVEKNNLKQC